jgi:hypothetical protein
LPSLKFYGKEAEMIHSLGVNTRRIVLDKNEALVVARKLCRHFKFREPEIKFYGSRDSGTMIGYWIRVSQQPSLYVLIHELAHVYNMEKYRNRGHTKKLMSTIKRFTKYCIKKEFWGLNDAKEEL